MTRVQKVKNFVYGIGALGGTVAVFATVLEQFYGDDKKTSKLSNQLKAESVERDGVKWPKWDHNWDKRQPKEDDVNNNNNSTTTRNIILIRHGQYNLDGKDDSERYLTDLGRRQAALTGKRLAELALPYSFILHSDMKRAIETANIISEDLTKVPVLPADAILREGSPIAPEPKVASWRPEYHWDTDGARIEAAFRKHFHRAPPSQTEDTFEVVVCHANVIRYFVCRALQLPPEAWLRLSLKHASLTWMVIRPSGKVYTRCLGEAGHFSPEMLTTS